MLKSFLKKILKVSSLEKSQSSDDEYKDHLYTLILAGGGGTRLWPRSRNKTPKQFLKLFKNRSLMQVTYDRFLELVPKERIFCVTVSEEYKADILKQVPGFVKENIIVEPERKETGPAHALGAYVIKKLDPDAVIITEAADRLVNPIHRYLNILKVSASLAYKERVLVALGVEPKYPHTGLGHIKRGQKYTQVDDVDFYKLDKFVEKPKLDLAKKYTESGEYYWNAGEFVWRADAILSEIEKYAPDIYKNITKLDKGFSKDNLAKAYKEMPKIAIDYAVAEKSENFIVAHGDFGWTDIGDWKEVWENLPKDVGGNVIIKGEEGAGEIINIDTTDALIHTDGRLIAVVDVDNLVIVDTKDALLVTTKSRAQSVKKIVERLKDEKRKEFL